MKKLSLLAAGAVVVIASAQAIAADAQTSVARTQVEQQTPALTATRLASAGMSAERGFGHANLMPVQLTQDKKERPGSVKQRVKRAWKNLTGYTFNVACPIPIPFSHRTCTETGKNQDAARAKCTSQNPFCYVTASR